MSRDRVEDVDPPLEDLSAEDLAAFDLSSEPEAARESLRSLARQRDLLEDERWRSLARGTSSEQNRAELRKLAARGADERALYNLASPSGEPPVNEEKPAPLKSIAVKPLPTRKIRFSRTIGVTLALAAMATGVWLGRPKEEPLRLALGPLPVFSVNADVNDVRGPEGKGVSSLVVLRDPRTALKITLSADQERPESLDARVFLLRFGMLTLLDAPLKVQKQSIVLEGTRESLLPFLPSGDYELVFAIGYAGRVPLDPKTISAALREPFDALSISRVKIRLEGDSPSAVKGDRKPPMYNQAASPLDVLFYGCSAVVATPPARALPVCQLAPKAQLKLVLKARSGALVTARIGDKPLPGFDSSLVASDAGQILDLADIEPTGAITIEASHGTTRGWFSLPLAPLPAFPAQDLARAGNIAKARAEAEAALSGSDPGLKARSAGLLARILKNQGQLDESIAMFEQALSLDEAAGQLSDTMRDGTALSDLLVMNRHDFAGATRALERVSTVLPQVPDATATVAYFAAHIHAQTGDVRHALARYDEALRWGRRLGLDEIVHNTFQVMPQVFVQLGRTREARALLEEEKKRVLSHETSSACDKATLHTQSGWVLYLIAMSTKGKKADLDDAQMALEAAAAIGCDEPFLRSMIQTNFALVALEKGDPQAALVNITAARAAHASPGPHLEDWWLLVEAQSTLKMGERGPSVKGARDRLKDLAARTKEADVRLAAKIGYAEALDALGEEKAAREAYAEADEEAFRLSLGVAFGTGAAASSTNNGRATEKRLDFLLRLSESKANSKALEEALEVARRSRARVLASLERTRRLGSLTKAERDEWNAASERYRDARVAAAVGPADAQRRAQKALDEALAKLGPLPVSSLAKPAAGELLLVYHPLPQGYLGLAVTREGIVAKRLSPIDPANSTPLELTRTLLEPFRHDIESVRVLKLAPHGALARISFHALPWNNEAPLISALPIAYVVDLAQPSASAAPDSPGSSEGAPLIVADMESKLLGLEAEIDAVRQKFPSSPQQQPFAPRDVTALAAAIDGKSPALFHFAGHAQFSGLSSAPTGLPSIWRGDLDGWESGLRMKDGSLFSVGDVLTLGHVPAVVVLSACETGRALDDENGSGVGVAQAFVAKGSRAVVAATDLVDSQTAANLMIYLYQAPSFPADVPEALRFAQTHGRKGEGWERFRVLVP